MVLELMQEQLSFHSYSLVELPDWAVVVDDLYYVELAHRE